MTVAIDAARAAGKQLLESFEGVATGVDAKSSHTDLVSDADRESETVIVSAIRWAFPEDAIVAEEGSLEPGGSGRTWYIDPLDGTINYLYGVPHWSVVLCLADADGALAGVVYDPVRDELFGAERGAGAHVSRAGGAPRAAAYDRRSPSSGAPWSRRALPMSQTIGKSRRASSRACWARSAICVATARPRSICHG